MKKNIYRSWLLQKISTQSKNAKFYLPQKFEFRQNESYILLAEFPLWTSDMEVKKDAC